jgi:N-acetylmuramoyl-L-alanine amidase
MRYNRIVISSGHSKFVRGASDELDEVTEARRVVEHLADELSGRGVEVITYHDDVSTSQNENLQRIVDYHNAQSRDLDISVHFNAYVETDEPRGVEVLYVTQSALAAEVSIAIADAGDLINRGAKKRTDLYFLNQTAMPSILIETAFCDSTADAKNYRDNFDAICEAIASVLSDGIEYTPPEEAAVVTGTCSHFGGPDDMGVSASEGLAFIYELDEQNQFLFLPFQPTATTGLARRLNPCVHYCAMRWDYSVHPKETLLQKAALVRNPKTGFALTCVPADWGPHEEKTGRIIDLSPSMMLDLGLETDDVVEVTFPWTEDVA